MSVAKKLTEIPVKIFKHGGSQAVRLPKELRIHGLEAVGHREGESVVLRPAPAPEWPKDYWSLFGEVWNDLEAPDPLPASTHRDQALEEL